MSTMLRMGDVIRIHRLPFEPTYGLAPQPSNYGLTWDEYVIAPRDSVEYTVLAGNPFTGYDLMQTNDPRVLIGFRLLYVDDALHYCTKQYGFEPEPVEVELVYSLEDISLSP